MIWSLHLTNLCTWAPGYLGWPRGQRLSWLPEGLLLGTYAYVDIPLVGLQEED